jgi:hypothetical protein
LMLFNGQKIAFLSKTRTFLSDPKLFNSSVGDQTFSVKKYNKSRHRSSLADSHLSAILRIATSETIPDFPALVNAHQRLHSSH